MNTNLITISDNLSENISSYSNEAVENLIAIEREHAGISVDTYRGRRAFKYLMPEVEEYIKLLNKNICQRCCDSISDVNKIFPYPCQILSEARAGASAETLVAVALLIGGSNE